MNIYNIEGSNKMSSLHNKKIGLLLPYRTEQSLIDFVNTNLTLNSDLVFRGAQDGKTDDELRELSQGIAPNSYAENLADGSTVFITRETVVAGMKAMHRHYLMMDAMLLWSAVLYLGLN